MISSFQWSALWLFSRDGRFRQRHFHDAGDPAFLAPIVIAMAFEAATLSRQLGRPSLFVALAAQRNAGDVDIGGLPAVWNL